MFDAVPDCLIDVVLDRRAIVCLDARDAGMSALVGDLELILAGVGRRASFVRVRIARHQDPSALARGDLRPIVPTPETWEDLAADDPPTRSPPTTHRALVDILLGRWAAGRSDPRPVLDPETLVREGLVLAVDGVHFHGRDRYAPGSRVSAARPPSGSGRPCP